MRDPGTEPLEMIAGDAVELTKMLYAAREAHAAEVARLRKALEGIKAVLSGAAPIDRGIALLHRDREEIEQHLTALAAYKEATRG